jgi:DNA-binding CsgD family transcriptional regulator
MAGSDLLFGRASEQAVLERLLCRPSAERAMLLAGDVGIGKTALLRHAARIARQAGYVVLSGHCYDALEAGPYSPLVEALKQLSTICELPVPVKVAPRSRLGEAGSSWLGKDARQARDSFVRDLSDAITGVAERSPALLIIDDVQWADAGTLLVINCLLDIDAPDLVLLLAERIDEAAPTERINLRMAIRSKVQQMELAGLDVEATRELAAAEMGGGALSYAEISAIAESTRGNPLFIRELLTDFRRRGDANIDTVGDFFRRERLPNNLGAMIDLRLSWLAPHVLRTLEAASVLGGAFLANIVAELLEQETDSVVDAFEAAIDHRIARRSGEERRYEFVHQFYRKRLYERLPARAQRNYHARAAAAMRCRILPYDESELARHSALASNETTCGEAIEDCARAADRAEGLLEFDTAAHYWQLAVNCAVAADMATRADLKRRLGWSCWATGRWERAIAAWREAALLFQTIGNERRLGEVALALAEVHRWRGQLDDAERWALQAARLAVLSVSERALAAAIAGDVLSVRTGGTPAREHLDQALGYWKEGGCHPSTAWWLGHGLLMLGDLGTALQVSEEGIGEALRQGAGSTAALIASGLLVSDLGVLRIDEARQRLKVVKAGTNPYDSSGRISLLISEAYLLGYSGQWSKALELTDEWTAEFRLAGRYQVATACMTAAAAHLASGQADEAERQIRTAMPNLEAMQPAAALYLAEALIRQGRLDSARSIVEDVVSSVLTKASLAASRAMLGNVVASIGGNWTASCYEMLAKEPRAMLTVYSCTSVHRVLGRLAATLRDWPSAIRYFEDALDHLHNGQAWSELALALADYGVMRRARNRRGDRVKAAALDTRATQLFAELGMWNPIVGMTAPAARQDPFGLSSREREVLELVAYGMRNREIAERLTISERTVQRHLENIFGKMRVDARTEAVVKAAEEGLLPQRAFHADSNGEIEASHPRLREFRA